MINQNLALAKEVPFDQSQVNEMIAKIQQHFMMSSTKKIKKIKKAIDTKAEVMKKIKLLFQVNHPSKFINPTKFFLSKHDVYLSLYQPEDSGLGELPLSPFTYTNKILKIEHRKNKGIILCHIEKIQYESELDLEQLISIFDQMNTQEQKKTSNNLKILHQYFKLDLKSLFNPQPFSQQAFDLFYNNGDKECFTGFVININNGIFKLQNIIVSEKLLDHTGITTKMFMDYVIHSKLLPAFFSLGDSYLTFWNALIQGILNKSSFQVDAINYDGVKQNVELNQYELFLLGNESNSIIKCIKWIIIPRNNSLIGEERKMEIEKEYLREKDDSGFRQFQEDFDMNNQKDSKKECGFKLISNNQQNQNE